MHLLIIGGTGMLSGAAVHFAEAGHSVSVVGRLQKNFEKLQDKSRVPMFPLLGDYRKEEIFRLVSEAIAARGPFDAIISWCPEYRVLERIALLNYGASNCRVIQVKGSRRFFGDPSIALPEPCIYQEVFLGFKKEPEGSRWLTHEEISAGVVKAFAAGERRQIIGQIEPYEERPD